MAVSLIVVDRSFVAANARELERMRALVSRLSDRQLGEMVNEYWSVAGVLGHMAFWDGRALYLATRYNPIDIFSLAKVGTSLPPTTCLSVLRIIWIRWTSM